MRSFKIHLRVFTSSLSELRLETLVVKSDFSDWYQ